MSSGGPPSRCARSGPRTIRCWWRTRARARRRPWSARSCGASASPSGQRGDGRTARAPGRPLSAGRDRRHHLHGEGGLRPQAAASAADRGVPARRRTALGNRPGLRRHHPFVLRRTAPRTRPASGNRSHLRDPRRRRSVGRAGTNSSRRWLLERLEEEDPATQAIVRRLKLTGWKHTKGAIDHVRDVLRDLRWREARYAQWLPADTPPVEGTDPAPDSGDFLELFPADVETRPSGLDLSALAAACAEFEERD